MIRLLLAFGFFVFSQPVAAESIVLASTTSTQNSGLLDYLLATFSEETGIDVKVLAVGTGQAMLIARNGDADLLLVHHRPSEDAFVQAGYGTDRRDVMYNDFVIVGPRDDPAGIAGGQSASDALQKIANIEADFVSRGDESGTHKKELELWEQSNIHPEGSWYREIGAGMGAALNMASALNAYVLTDRGTWLTFGNKGSLDLLVSGDPDLLNPYAVILVNPARHPQVKAAAARRLSDWLVSPRGQKMIGDFLIDEYQAFCPVRTEKNRASNSASICPADD